MLRRWHAGGRGRRCGRLLDLFERRPDGREQLDRLLLPGARSGRGRARRHVVRPGREPGERVAGGVFHRIEIEIGKGVLLQVERRQVGQAGEGSGRTGRRRAGGGRRSRRQGRRHRGSHSGSSHWRHWRHRRHRRHWSHRSGWQRLLDPVAGGRQVEGDSPLLHVTVDDPVDEVLAPFAQLDEADAHPGRPVRPVRQGARPDHLALSLDDLETVAETELEVEHPARGLWIARHDVHAGRRDVRRVLAQEATEAVELELDLGGERYTPRIPGNAGVIDH